MSKNATENLDTFRFFHHHKENFKDLNPESSSGGSSDSSDEDTGSESEPDDDDDDDNSRKSRDDGGADKGYPDGPSSSSGAVTTTRTIIAPGLDFTDPEFEHLLKMIEDYSLDKTSGITDQDVTNFINNAKASPNDSHLNPKPTPKQLSPVP